MSSYLITGSSRGIGLELVNQLAAKPEEEVGIIFASARNPSNPKFQELLQQHPDRIIYVPLDVTDKESARNAAKLITATLDGKGLDVLINNAGVMRYGPIEEMYMLSPSLCALTTWLLPYYVNITSQVVGHANLYFA